MGKKRIYYHILMWNNWEEIVKEQLALIKKSGLYDEVDKIKIGCLGDKRFRLMNILKDYPKAEISYHSIFEKEYEFPTLNLLHSDASKEDFQGLYLHTKGVCYPFNSGGKYWRDYMNYYNITRWRFAISELRTNDLCGVKLIKKKWRPHYSGNFFWFKSSYIKTLSSVSTLNSKDRYEAEFWVGKSKGEFACMCDEFVDYNTKGEFRPPINFVHTLAYNVVEETEKATKSLYEKNNDFHHIIVDLGFPLEKGGVIPKDIKIAKSNNSKRLKALAEKYGSEYIKIENVGVSQNWTAVYKHLKMRDGDVLIGADPDERPQQNNWVEAMGEVLRSDHKIGMVSLTMPQQRKKLPSVNVNIDGIKGIMLGGGGQWALIGFSKPFIEAMGGCIPHPKGAEKYGWIENEVSKHFIPSGYNLCFLPDFTVIHTDYEIDPTVGSKLLREWKNLIVFKKHIYGQISLEEFLERKRDGEELQ